MKEDEELIEVQESFGEFLKRHREASGKSLEEIARVTRISKSYLAAFEANDLGSLPETTFSRGFLKSYANEVGMDVDECLRRFEQLEKASAPTQIRDMRRDRKTGLILGGEQLQSPKAPLFIGIGVVLIFIVVTAVLYFYQRSSRDDVAQNPEVIIETDEGNVIGSENQPSAAENQGQKELATPAPPSVLEMSAKQRVSLLIRLDESAPQEIVLNPGETKSFDVYRQIEIKNADRAKVSFSYNGKPIEVTSSVLKLFNRYLFSE